VAVPPPPPPPLLCLLHPAIGLLLRDDLYSSVSLALPISYLRSRALVALLYQPSLLTSSAVGSEKSPTLTSCGVPSVLIRRGDGAPPLLTPTLAFTTTGAVLCEFDWWWPSLANLILTMMSPSWEGVVWWSLACDRRMNRVSVLSSMVGVTHGVSVGRFMVSNRWHYC
jgi:hypothetical protein